MEGGGGLLGGKEREGGRRGRRDKGAGGERDRGEEGMKRRNKRRE